MSETPAEDVIAAFRTLGRDRAGVTAIEYALIAGLIALAIISAVGMVGTSLTNFFMGLHGNLSAMS